jgi:hypothetical protein
LPIFFAFAADAAVRRQYYWRDALPLDAAPNAAVAMCAAYASPTPRHAAYDAAAADFAAAAADAVLRCRYAPCAMPPLRCCLRHDCRHTAIFAPPPATPLPPPLCFDASFFAPERHADVTMSPPRRYRFFATRLH